MSQRFRLIACIVIACATLFAGFSPQTVSASPLSNRPAIAIPANAGPDLVAYIKNGDQPVLAPSGKLTPSSTRFATERGPDIAIPNCLQPPANFDPATATTAQLKMYGFSPREPGESMAHWLSIASQMKYRACSYYETNVYSEQSAPAFTPTGKKVYDHPANAAIGALSATPPIYNASLEYDNDKWTGKVADQNCASQPGEWLDCQDYTHSYTEIDSDFYINCPTWSPQITGYGSAAEWVGLGGTAYANELVQDGVEVGFHNNGNGTYYDTLMTWWEYVGSAGKVTEQGVQLFASCGDHLYAKVWGGNCYHETDLNNGWYFDFCNGPFASDQSAEAILERDGGYSGGLPVGEPYGANTTFYGVGLTDKGSYIGMGTAQHDYANTMLDGVYVSVTGPIQNDPGDPPYDQYTLTVYNPCGGYGSCP